MKPTQSFAAAILAAASLFSGTVLAADISHGMSGLLVVEGRTTHFGADFMGAEAGDTFADRYAFSVFGSVVNLDAGVLSFSDSPAEGMDITGFSLYSWDGDLVSSGAQLMGGNRDIWELDVDNLTQGNYYVQVSGTVLSAGAVSYGAQLAMAPVPEPATYAMLLAGLGALGVAARRKASRQ